MIGSDTIVVLNNKIYGKPADIEDAGKMLLELRNKTHVVYTSVFFEKVIKEKHQSKLIIVDSNVTFNNFSNKTLERYLKTNESLDKAGAYGIQGPALTFVEKVEGSYSNVVGFPLSHVTEILEEMLR